MESIKDYNEKNIENAITSPEVLTLPMIALRGKVILPNVYTSFDVGRIKSLAAVNAAVDSENPLVFVSAQKDAKVENPSLKDVFEIGTVCRIKNVTRMPGDNIRVNGYRNGSVSAYRKNGTHELFVAAERQSEQGSLFKRSRSR